MIPRIKNNYMRPSRAVGKDFKVEVDPLPTKFDNYFIESCRAAEEIYDLKTGKLHVMYSGGIDSEYALSVFLHLGMDVTPVVVKLNPGYNDHDLDYSLKFCESKNIKPTIIDIDFDHYIKSGTYYDIMEITEGTACALGTTTYATGLLDGSVIIGMGEPYMGKHPETSEWYFCLDRYEWAVERYMELKGIDGTGFFNGYSKEMVAAWLMDPQMIKLANNLVPGKLDTQSSKHFVYNRDSGFDLEIRQKYSGYEKIYESIIYQHETVKDWAVNRPNYFGRWAVKYSEFTSHLQNKS
jgi:hypothetical protein